MKGVFLGSFDPFHNGHMEIINKGLELFNQVIVVPSCNHPDKKNLSDYDTRFSMLYRALETLILSNKVILSGIEYNKNDEINYTYKTLDKLKNIYGEDLCLLITQETRNQMIDWENYDYIIKNYDYQCFDRKTPISSSLIKLKVKLQEDIHNLVPKEVDEFIKYHNLYSYGENPCLELINGGKIFASRSVAVVVVIQNEDGDYLTIKRSENCPDEIGKYAFISGYLDWGETAKHACLREIAEEINFYPTINKLSFIGVDTNPSNNRQNVCLVYCLRLSNEDIALTTTTNEVSEIKVFSKSELPQLAFNHNKYIDYQWLGE